MVIVIHIHCQQTNQPIEFTNRVLFILMLSHCEKYDDGGSTIIYYGTDGNKNDYS